MIGDVVFGKHPFYPFDGFIKTVPFSGLVSVEKPGRPGVVDAHIGNRHMVCEQMFVLFYEAVSTLVVIGVPSVVRGVRVLTRETAVPKPAPG